MFPYRFHQICVCFSFWAWSNCDWESAWFWFDLLLIIHLIERKLGKSERRNNRSKATSSSWLIYAYASIIWFDVISHYSLAVCVIWFVVSFFFFFFGFSSSILFVVVIYDLFDTVESKKGEVFAIRRGRLFV